MKQQIWDFASYNLLSLFSPPVGREHWHCHMKRGFTKARKRESEVKRLLEQDNTAQRIGILAQRGVYEFHHHPLTLHRGDVVEEIAEILHLNEESVLVQQRVIEILKNYQDKPLLLGQKIIQLNRGDEGFPKPISMEHGNYRFNLYAAIDCIFEESDGTVHILDFKTGTSDFDVRQGYIYLLAASYFYPQGKAVASFYNLETGKQSEPLSASDVALESYKIELARIAKQHQQDLKRYRFNPREFSDIFPPNPGFRCSYCPFKSICEFSLEEVAA